MTDDRWIRQVLVEALPDVDDVENARRQVAERVAHRRRRRTMGRLGIAVAAVAGLGWVLTMFVMEPADAPGPMPVIGQTPDRSEPATESQEDPCPPPESLPEPVRGFVTTWTTTTTSLDEDVCVLPGRVGPAPRFDVDPLGREWALEPDGLPSEPDTRPNTRFGRVEGHPLIHVGSPRPSSDAQVMMGWSWTNAARNTPVLCVESTCSSDRLPEWDPIRMVEGGGSGLIGVTLWVPPETSVVAFELNDEPLVWQRPVAQTAVIALNGHDRVELGQEWPLEPLPGSTYRVRVLDQDGEELAVLEREVAPA